MPTPSLRKSDLETLRAKLRAGLPERIDRAVDAYDAFGAAAPPDDAKGFAAHHAACKAALAHVEMLTKLLRWAEGDLPQAAGSNDDDAPDIGALLSQARNALDAFGDDEPPTDDDDDE